MGKSSGQGRSIDAYPNAYSMRIWKELVDNALNDIISKTKLVIY